MLKNVKDDFNITSNLRYVFQRAGFIADSLYLREIDTLSLLLAMLKDKYSVINKIYFENGIAIDIDHNIECIISDKEVYESLFERKYPFDEEAENKNSDSSNSSEKTELREGEKNTISDPPQEIQIIMYKETPTQYNFDLPYSKHLKEAICDSGRRCRVCGQNYIDDENLLYSILNLRECSAKRFIDMVSKILYEKSDVQFDICDLIDNLINCENICYDSIEQKIVIPKPLESCCTILNDKYEKGTVCDILNRDEEIFEVWAILSKKQKSNVILTGKPGVGKTAIVEAITMAIVNETCPKNFIGNTVVELNISGMVAGTKYRGEFEKKVEYLKNFIIQHDNLIIFVDEIHQIMGAGSAEGSGPDLSGSLKPILARDNVKFIGATTMEEYKRYICRDSAFRRRLELVEVDEPKFEHVLPMLEVKIDNLKKHHGVDISDGELDYIKLCAACFNTTTCNPDKTLDLIDRTMAISGSMCSSKEVRREHIEKVFTKNYRDFNKLSDELKKSTAFHEVGHYTVSMLKREVLVDESVLAISIVPGFGFVGANILEDTDILPNTSIEYMKANIATLLAGRIAEQIHSGKKNSGASSDLKRATGIARRMIINYGLSEETSFKNMYFYENSCECDLPISEKAIDAVNFEAEKIINDVYLETTELLKANWEKVNVIVESLLKEKIISGDKFDYLFKK